MSDCMNNFECPNNTVEILIKQLKREVEKLMKDTTSTLLLQDNKISETVVYIKENLSSVLRDMFDSMKLTGELDKIITETIMLTSSTIEIKTEHIVSVKSFGAVGDGECDDTDFIQNAIDYANMYNRKVFIPKGVYLISKPIMLNGCSIEGEPSNIFNSTGSVIKCKTNNFTAIKQGSTSVSDIMFNVSHILVTDAYVGFEFKYVINSVFNQLYVKNCDIGFKLGDKESVGSMFCKFNGLYTDNCRVGIESISSTYFNNNEFNNGFIQGTDYAMLLQVNGGYGAVGNVFNNVEFRSDSGRGIVLTSCINTVFNSCYFECGGNAIHGKNYSNITLNNCTFALFKKANINNDTNVIYAVSGFQLVINGGLVFLDSNYEDVFFFGTGNEATYQNVSVIKSLSKNGSASGFDFFAKSNVTEQVVLTSTVSVASEETATVTFNYAKPFSKIPEVVIPVIRGADAGVLSFVLTEKTSTGGAIKVVNKSTVSKSISFSIYAKVI